MFFRGRRRKLAAFRSPSRSCAFVKYTADALQLARTWQRALAHLARDVAQTGLTFFSDKGSARPLR